MKNCFIIINYNDYQSTKHLVDNIIDYECLDLILIVDNDSKISEKELLKTIRNKKVEKIFNEMNMGYSTAINIGTRYLTEKYGKCNFIISNSDIVILSEQDIQHMIDTLNDKRIGLVGPQLLELGHISRGYKNIKPYMDVLLNTPIIRNFIGESTYLYDEEHYNNKISYVDVLSSSFFLISSDTMQKINYMDESVFLYYEDYILAKKVKNLGLEVAIYNDAKVKHLYSVSVDKSIAEVNKYKLLKESQYYYHTIYNDANSFEKGLMKFMRRLGVIRRMIFRK